MCSKQKRPSPLAILVISVLLGLLALAALPPRTIGPMLPQYRNKVYIAMYGATLMIESALHEGYKLEMGEHEKNSSFLQCLECLGWEYQKRMERDELFVLSCDVTPSGKQLYLGMRGGRMNVSKARDNLVRLTEVGLIEGMKNNKGEPYDGGPLFMIRYEGTYEGDL